MIKSRLTYFPAFTLKSEFTGTLKQLINYIYVCLFSLLCALWPHYSSSKNNNCLSASYFSLFLFSLPVSPPPFLSPSSPSLSSLGLQSVMITSVRRALPPAPILTSLPGLFAFTSPWFPPLCACCSVALYLPFALWKECREKGSFWECGC